MNAQQDGNLKKCDAVHVPGQQLTVDHFVWSTKGFFFLSISKIAESEMFVGR